jgi:hypothetical protein
MKKTPDDKNDKLIKQYKFIMQNEYDFIIRRLEHPIPWKLYKYCVNFYALPLKKSQKEMPEVFEIERFIKRSKMKR